MYKSNRYEIFDDYAIIYVERRNFDDVDEAGIFAENEREKIYGEYAGKS